MGQFSSGVLNGAAILFVKLEGVVTVSHFVNGKRHGVGQSYGYFEIYQHDPKIKPHIYIGEYQNGLWNGQGRLCQLEDSHLYQYIEGVFENCARKKGIYSLRNGKIIYSD